MVGFSPRHYAADTALQYPFLEQRRRAWQGAQPVGQRAFFIWRFSQLIARSRAFLVLYDAAHFVGGAVATIGPHRHLAMAVERALIA